MRGCRSAHSHSIRKPTVVIAEDDAVIREGCLQATLEPFFEIVAAVEDGEAAVIPVDIFQPTLFVCSMMFADRGGQAERPRENGAM